MRYILQISFFFLSAFTLQGQQNIVFENGTVSFISTRNVYVKFASTQKINKGDTLFIDHLGAFVPGLVVENKSSSSTVCTPLGTHKLKVDDKVIAKVIVPLEPLETEEENDETTIPLEDEIGLNNDPVIKPEEEDQMEQVLFKEKIKGRISVASYSNISDYRNRHRMRYAFSFRGYNLKNSRFSVENYITFRHTLNDSISIAEALKVYSLNVKYDFSKNTSLIFGRKINPKFSSMGAIDGLQFEKGWGRFSVGAVAGTRPDFQDYSLNLNLLQYGAYLSFGSLNPSKYAQTTLGFIEQTNNNNTDRRFIYLQHSSTLAKNLNFFGSMEVDLFEKINSETKNTTQLTNLYLSLRYRFNNKFRVSASYDSRKNIIYYESYKNFIDQLIDDETRQGWRFGINYRPTKKISWGANVSMRFQQSQQNPSRSLTSFINFSRIPFVNGRLTLRANFLQTDYLESRIYGARLSKELIRGKLNGEIYYRWVDYQYTLGDRIVHQNIGGASLTIRIQKQLSLHLFYEGVHDKANQNYHRFNAKIIKRF